MQIRVGKDATEFLLGDALTVAYHTTGFPRPIFLARPSHPAASR